MTGGTYARELRGCHPAPPPPPPGRHEPTPRGAPQRHELAPEAAAEAGGKLQGRRQRLRHPRQRGERKRYQALRPAVRPEAGRRSSTPDRCAYPRGRLQDHPHNPVQLRKFRLDLQVLELARCCVAAPLKAVQSLWLWVPPFKSKILFLSGKMLLPLLGGASSLCGYSAQTTVESLSYTGGNT